MTNERLVRDLVREVWNGGDLDRLPDLFADSIDHGGRPDDLAGLRSWHETDARIWSEQRFDILDLVACADRVALRWRATARHTGQWGPVPATGRTISWEGVHFFTLDQGKIVGMWAMADVFNKAMQLGATLSPPHT